MDAPEISCEIMIGRYIIRPYPVPDGRVFIEIMRVDGEVV